MSNALADLQQQEGLLPDQSWMNESALVIIDDELEIVLSNDSKPNLESGAMSSHNMITILTTVLVPLVFGIIVVVGIIGNALVMIVVATNQQMRNTTNVLILNLAMADLLFIVLCVPFTATDYVLNHWPFGLTWCQAVQYLIYVTSYVSIYTLILMSFDRFLAVVFPVASLPYRTVRNSALALVILWTLIGITSIPIWFTHHLQDKRPAPANRTGTGNISVITLSDGLKGEQWCRFEDGKYSSSGFHVAFFISGYAIPLTLIILMYLKMLSRLWHPVGHQISQDSLRNKRRVTKLVLVVIVVFAVCWAPIQFVLLMKALKVYQTKGPEDFPRIIFQIFAHILAYVNSCVNPILYAFLSDNFRRAFHQFLPDCCHKVMGGSRGRPALQYELTTLRADRRNSSNLKRYGKRGKLVKHGATPSNLSVASLEQLETNNGHIPLGPTASAPRDPVALPLLSHLSVIHNGQNNSEMKETIKSNGSLSNLQGFPNDGVETGHMSHEAAEAVEQRSREDNNNAVIESTNTDGLLCTQL
ncbi:hypothetical protein TCAL_12840 [Tigriopus californicus]|uniref:G-protein coupled receptors family 1 profile domain-containing protein n=2 Tax=Tigriopus californicus TaxID=6832 RepID=A0A553NSR1_TIGCA|nr:allatostatin-A receptor-like isoform X2 [Tigriopus californicus]TRY68475.1 hypothetical protein TCAL_12840 [Tigriopus californicus]